MNGLALCAGVGGFELALKRVFADQYQCVCYVEGEAYCAATLKARMETGELDTAPIWSDVRTFDAEPWREIVDIVSAGYPCQPFSVAGARKGENDPRHLWPAIERIIGIIRPSFVFIENVPGHVSLGFETVRNSLQRMDYEVSAGIYSAAEVGAWHLRKRLFVICANSECLRQLQSERRQQNQRRWVNNLGTQTKSSDPYSLRLQSQRKYEFGSGIAPDTKEKDHKFKYGFNRNWVVEPPMGRVVNGVPYWVDRIRALGNSICPEQAANAISSLLQEFNL